LAGSRIIIFACKSLKIVFSPFPPKIIILDPAKIAEC